MCLIKKKITYHQMVSLADVVINSIHQNGECRAEIALDINNFMLNLGFKTDRRFASRAKKPK